MDKVLRRWWMKHVVKPNPDVVSDETMITVPVFALEKLVASVRGTERLRIVKLRKSI